MMRKIPKYPDSIEACAAHYGEDADAMRTYLIEGEKRALAMDNRGPIRFGPDGNLADDIKQAYARYGFYVFTNVLGTEELADLKSDLRNIEARLPTDSKSTSDAKGRPALGADTQLKNLFWAKPLSDPLGGTKAAGGRHQVKLFEPDAGPDAPQEAIFLILGSLQYSDACLRTYGHPQLLRVAEAINGEDFTPFSEALFVKQPGVGAAVSWHQDGTTHWDSPDLDEGTHGFNFMAQVYDSTPVNGVWVVPGTHRQGRLDIVALVSKSGSERLEGAVPLVCDAGDVIICSRQLVHGSFANSGFEPRVTVNFGFHRRQSVLGVTTRNNQNQQDTYTADRIRERAKAIALAIDARRQRFPFETPYVYKPLAGDAEAIRWDEQVRARMKDYNALDLNI